MFNYSEQKIGYLCPQKSLASYFVSCNAHMSCLLFSPVLWYAFPVFLGGYFGVSLGGKVLLELVNDFMLGLKFRNWSWLGKNCEKT